jgi:hypothetical protein
MLCFIFVILCYFFSFVWCMHQDEEQQWKCYFFAICFLVYIHVDWNFISYTFTFSSSLLSSINFVPSSERYKLQNRFRVYLFVCCFFLCDYSIKRINFSMFFYIKKKNWNAVLYVIDEVCALVPGLVQCKAWISFKWVH